MPNSEAPTSKLKMTFTPNTIEHLGVRMYSTLPPVVAELIANSYDADASEVHIQLDDEGNFIEEEVAGEGYEWIQSFAYHDDEKNVFGSEKQAPAKNRRISEESLRKMKENELMQEEQNLALKVKNLKKKARQMQREGKV